MSRGLIPRVILLYSQLFSQWHDSGLQQVSDSVDEGSQHSAALVNHRFYHYTALNRSLKQVVTKTWSVQDYALQLLSFSSPFPRHNMLIFT